MDLNSALPIHAGSLSATSSDKKAIRVATSFEDLPPVACYAGKVDQAS